MIPLPSNQNAPRFLRSADELARELGVSVGAVLDGSVNDPVRLAEEQCDWEDRMRLDAEGTADCDDNRHETDRH